MYQLHWKVLRTGETHKGGMSTKDVCDAWASKLNQKHKGTLYHWSVKV